MSIAMLGWGSLVWDPRELPHYGPWKTGGPSLPIELARVSSDSRLTLVIDPAATPVPTRYALSPRSDILDAVEDLRRREGTVRKNIGFVILATGENSRTQFHEQHDVLDSVSTWCEREGMAGCVWTALPPNFRAELEVEFSAAEAVRYLERLGTSAREIALKYIRNAPPEVDTQVRREVSRRWPAS
jgi:hypothetical protein